MSQMRARGRVREVSIEATIIRKDGTIIPLGNVSYWNKNPFLRMVGKIRVKLIELYHTYVSGVKR